MAVSAIGISSFLRLLLLPPPFFFFYVSQRTVRGIKRRTSLAKSIQKMNGDWALSLEFRQIKLMAEVGDRQEAMWMSTANLASIEAIY